MEPLLNKLVGKTITSCEGARAESKEVIFDTLEGPRFRMYHSQDCCEYVFLEKVEGNIDDILNSPVLEVIDSESNKNPEDFKVEYQDSFTWTLFEIKTIKGSIKLRWYGESNGYYSESVNFVEL